MIKYTNMGKDNSISDIQTEQLPFSFIKKRIDAGNVKANWQKIKKQIAVDCSNHKADITILNRLN